MSFFTEFSTPYRLRVLRNSRNLSAHGRRVPGALPLWPNTEPARHWRDRFPGRLHAPL